MRRLVRVPLDPATLGELRRLATLVKKAKDPVQEASDLWDRKPRTPFDMVRGTLELMASGRGRCMYCEDSLGTDIEHFYPKAKYPQKAFSWPNYLLACSHCNSNLKRDKFPRKGGKPTLLDPTRDDPQQHLRFLPSSGEFKAIGPKGQPSIKVFGLNDKATPRKLPQARRATFLKLQLLLEEYDRCTRSKEKRRAALVKRAVLDEPFSAVLDWLLAIALQPAANIVLRPGIHTLITRHRIDQWR